MKRPQIVVIVIVIALVAVGGFILTNSSSKSKNTTNTSHGDMAKSADKADSPVAAKPNEVQIKDFAFGPDTLTVKKGTTVKWTNQDSAHHDITPTGGADDFKASMLLGKSESYSFTFNKVGEYTYKCSPHPYMKAKIVVTE